MGKTFRLDGQAPVEARQRYGTDGPIALRPGLQQGRGAIAAVVFQDQDPGLDKPCAHTVDVGDHRGQGCLSGLGTTQLQQAIPGGRSDHGPTQRQRRLKRAMVWVGWPKSATRSMQ